MTPTSSAPAGVVGPDPTSSGGGSTMSTDGQPVAMAAALAPVLQQLVTSLQSLATALQGSGALTSVRNTPGGAMGAPSSALAGAANMNHESMSRGGGGSARSRAGGDMASMPGMRGMPMGKDMGMIERTTPVDRTKAEYVRNAVRDFFGSIPRSAVQLGGEGNNHGRLPEALRQEFERRYPGVPAPTGVVYPKRGGTDPVGVVYNQPNAPDLPMGNAHRHDGSKDVMQHIWFGGNLDRAYSDLSMGGAQTMYGIMQRQGLA